MWLVPIAFSFARAAHGQGTISRLASLLIMLVAFYSYYPEDSLIKVIVTGSLLLLGLAPGHGKYFSVIHGKFDINEKELPIIDDVTNKLAYTNTYLAGALGMSLRWFFPFIPLVIWLAIVYNTNSVFFSGLLLLTGVWYYLGGRLSQRWGVRIGEVITGFILGGVTVW